MDSMGIRESVVHRRFDSITKAAEAISFTWLDTAEDVSGETDTRNQRLNNKVASSTAPAIRGTYRSQVMSEEKGIGTRRRALIHKQRDSLARLKGKVLDLAHPMVWHSISIGSDAENRKSRSGTDAAQEEVALVAVNMEVSNDQNNHRITGIGQRRCHKSPIRRGSSDIRWTQEICKEGAVDGVREVPTPLEYTFSPKNPERLCSVPYSKHNSLRDFLRRTSEYRGETSEMMEGLIPGPLSYRDMAPAYPDCTRYEVRVVAAQQDCTV
ncbi:hypothetical protein BJY52DRAFT_1227303 [Lactarius psammicola]|nr:hypothetical protein BJY52DRAFT_1227303 [Lactarius psammicola]